MAQRTVQGKDIVFLIDPDNGTDYELVVCLTSNSFERTANEIDASSKCGTEVLQGVKNRTINIEGNVQVEPTTGKVSEKDLNDIFEAGTKFGWAFGPETASGGDVTYSGTDAIITSLSYSAPNEGAATFSATVKLTGVPTVTVES